MLILNGKLINSMEVIRCILIGIWILRYPIVKSRVLLLSKMREILKEMLTSIFRLGFYFGSCSKWVIMEILLLGDVFVGLVYYTIMLKINAEIVCRNNFQLKFCCVLLGENDKWLKKINLHFKCSNFIFDVSVESF